MFFKCTRDGCKLKFVEKKELNDHMREHERDIRPFECIKCGQGFTQISSLQKHGRVHDKRKPFLCHFENCGMAFTQGSNLIRHERIHTGIKPYKCNMCDKSFASSSNLKQHKEIHQGDTDRQRFICPCETCHKEYLYFSSLKKHVLKSHRDKYKNLFSHLLKTEFQSIKDVVCEDNEETPLDSNEESKHSSSVKSTIKLSPHSRKRFQRFEKPCLSGGLSLVSSCSHPSKVSNPLSPLDLQKSPELSCKEHLEAASVQPTNPIRTEIQEENKETENPVDNSKIQKEDCNEMNNYENIAAMFQKKVEQLQNNEFQDQVILKSIVIQDLFTSSFRRLLNLSKPTIIQNLYELLGVRSLILRPDLQNNSFDGQNSFLKSQEIRSFGTKVDQNINKENIKKENDSDILRPNKEFMSPLRRPSNSKALWHNTMVITKEEKKE